MHLNKALGLQEGHPSFVAQGHGREPRPSCTRPHASLHTLLQALPSASPGPSAPTAPALGPASSPLAEGGSPWLRAFACISGHLTAEHEGVAQPANSEDPTTSRTLRSSGERRSRVLVPGAGTPASGSWLRGQ
uniref:Uncharacterized protein n=1 Tax=Molossus molossus TaxID=27622 RepID=A0A7J8FYR2_MOLMO|nr:hypothetical protein HJG59_008142 [Molossus molossus]